MSETESMKCPPPRVFVSDADGLTMWRAEIDGISVRRVFNGVQVKAFRGADAISFTLSSGEARHLSSLLLREAAE